MTGNDDRRSPVHARNLVATSQPLAVRAGLDALRRGGNAVDAALTAAVTLTVVEPTSNGLGSDAFALVWDGRELHGLNGSGRAPAAWTPERFAGRDRMPERGWDSVTVPGAVDAWRRLSDRFGKLPFAELFAPAIECARAGFAVTPFIADAWARAAVRFRDFPDFAACFLPDGRAPREGETFRCPDLAVSLESIAASGGRSFYEGDLAERIVAAAARDGGAMTARDLAEHAGAWVAPLAVDYRGVRLHELPPNGQGLAALIALGILERLAPPAGAAEELHLSIEAMKIGLVEVRTHVSDPQTMEVAADALLEDSFLDRCARAVDPGRAAAPAASLPADHGTVYLTAADASGLAVSFIQSNYMGFGSGVVVPGTGVSLQNRGAGFRLESGHPNRVGGGKRPFHTIIPAFVTRDGAAEMSFGVMGGDMQAQGHVQMMTRIFAGGQEVQAAADAPRWFIHAGGDVSVEPGFPDAALDGLRARGHRVRIEEAPGLFGGAQLIRRAGDGWAGGSDPRKDGMAAGF